MEFKANDSVVVALPQMHTRSSVLETGEIISVQGEQATVMITGEDVPRNVPVANLSMAEDVYGQETGNPYEMPVLNQERR